MSGPTIFDLRQSETRVLQDQLSLVYPQTADLLMAAINSDLTAPGRIIASNPASLVVNVNAGTVINPGTSKNRIMAPLANSWLNFLGATLTFPSSSGTITNSNGSNATITLGDSQFVAVLVEVTSSSQVQMTVGTAVGSLSAIVVPSPSGANETLGYLIAESNGSGTIQNITNAMLYQIAGGGSAGSGGGIKVPYLTQYAIVAGGGAGGSAYSSGAGGGGGAGGVLEGSLYLIPGIEYPIVIGAGGAASNGNTDDNGGNGNNSSILNTLAYGGGGGGGLGVSNAQNGGSGGGSGQEGGNGGDGITQFWAPQGNNGGYGHAGGGVFGGGGGGGAGQVGNSDTGNQNGANGGNGITINLTGSPITVGGGGGGGGGQPNGSSSGGSGGGGGSQAYGAGGIVANGSANTGGGGGGNSWGTTGSGGGGNSGGNGGSGVVYLSIPTANYTGLTTGSPTVTINGSYTVLTFNSTGSYTA